MGHKAARRIREIYAGQDELPLTVDPADDRCPRCGARPGDPCQLVDPTRCVAYDDDGPVVAS